MPMDLYSVSKFIYSISVLRVLISKEYSGSVFLIGACNLIGISCYFLSFSNLTSFLSAFSQWVHLLATDKKIDHDEYQ